MVLILAMQVFLRILRLLFDKRLQILHILLSFYVQGIRMSFQSMHFSVLC